MKYIKSRGEKILFGIGLFVIIIFILLFITFILIIFIRPIDGMITEDRPIFEKLCEFQLKCYSSPTTVYCNENWDTQYDKLSNKEKRRADRLFAWRGYHGCNESTEGFFISGNNYIKIKTCGCEYPV